MSYPLSFRSPFTKEEISHTIIYSFIAVVGTIGNGLVIKSFLLSRDQPGSRFVIALAAVDFVTSILVPIRAFVDIAYGYNHWPWGVTACLLIKPWPSAFVSASSWLLIAISLERMRQVVINNLIQYLKKIIQLLLHGKKE